MHLLVEGSHVPTLLHEGLSVHSNNAQSSPLNPVAQVHLPSAATQFPVFLQETSGSLQLNSGHDPSSPNAISPGQGLSEVDGLPLNKYNNY